MERRIRKKAREGGGGKVLESGDVLMHGEASQQVGAGLERACDTCSPGALKHRGHTAGPRVVVQRCQIHQYGSSTTTSSSHSSHG